MASFHFSAKTGGKGKASPHADYISREEKYAKKKDNDLTHKESGNMPEWASHNPSEFWKAADTFERANGCTYREIEIALPRELNNEQQIELVRDFVKQEIGDKHAYQFAIHNPKASIEGGQQPHAHIMFSERLNDGVARDPNHYFKRANSKHPERGGAKKERFGETPTEKKEYLVAQRERWAQLQNKYLERYGHEDRVDSRSLKAQGIERQPERHLGAGYVRSFNADQLNVFIELRQAEREVESRITERDSLIDVTTSLREALAEREIQIERDSPVLNINGTAQTLVVEEKAEFDIQALINSSMTEFNDIYKQMQNEQRKAEQSKHKRTDDRKLQDKNQGWSFSR